MYGCFTSGTFSAIRVGSYLYPSLTPSYLSNGYMSLLNQCSLFNHHHHLQQQQRQQQQQQQQHNLKDYPTAAIGQQPSVLTESIAISRTKHGFSPSRDEALSSSLVIGRHFRQTRRLHVVVEHNSVTIYRFHFQQRQVKVVFIFCGQIITYYELILSKIT